MSDAKYITIPISLLKEYLSYDPDTGELTWTKDRCSWVKAGMLAGSAKSNGYRQLNFNGKVMNAHRVCWALHYGVWPDGHIDHINRVKDDNRIVNLRCVSRTGNMRNAKLCSNNTSGVNGVHFDKRTGKWIARICRDWLGRYDTKEDAVAARKAAEKEHGYHPNHGINLSHEV